MTRSTVITIILVSIGIAGGIYHFYDQAVTARQQEEAARQAAESVRKKKEDEAHAKAIVAQTAPTPTPTPTPDPNAPAAGYLVIGTPKSAPTPTPPSAKPTPAPVFLGPEPPAGQPRPPVIALAEAWIRANKLTSVSLGNPPVAIFGKRDLRPGSEVSLGNGLKMTVASVGDGWVEFSTAEGYRFRARSSTGE